MGLILGLQIKIGDWIFVLGIRFDDLGLGRELGLEIRIGKGEVGLRITDLEEGIGIGE